MRFEINVSASLIITIGRLFIVLKRIILILSAIRIELYRPIMTILITEYDGSATRSLVRMREFHGTCAD